MRLCRKCIFLLKTITFKTFGVKVVEQSTIQTIPFFSSHALTTCKLQAKQFVFIIILFVSYLFCHISFDHILHTHTHTHTHTYIYIYIYIYTLEISGGVRTNIEAFGLGDQSSGHGLDFNFEQMAGIDHFLACNRRNCTLNFLALIDQ